MISMKNVRWTIYPMALAFAVAPATARQVDYSGLGLNTKQVAALRASDAKADASDRASFEKLWAKAPPEMKSAGLSKPEWFALYKWSITMELIGMCSHHLTSDEVNGMRHVFDDLRGKSQVVDGMLEVGDEAFQTGDAASNDPDAPDRLTCEVTLRGLDASNDQAIAEIDALPK